jgi:hypothetical protein
MENASKKYDIPPIYYSPPYEVQQNTGANNIPISHANNHPLPHYPQQQIITHNQPQQQQQQSSGGFFKNPKFKKTICWAIAVGLILLLILVAFIYLKKRKQKASQENNKDEYSPSNNNGHEYSNYPSKGDRGYPRNDQYPESVRDRGIMAEREADRDAARIRSSGVNDRYMSDQESALPSLRDRWKDEQYRRRSAMQQQPQPHQQPQQPGMMQAPIGRDPMAPMSPNTPLDPMNDPMMNQQPPDQAMMGGDPNIPYQEDVVYADDPNGSPIQD